MKIAAVHMSTILADIKRNMTTAENNIREAAEKGAELVLLPEFFTTGFSFSPRLLRTVLMFNNVQEQLNEWAKKYNVIIGGSYLALAGEDVKNVFSLTFPGGEVFFHHKDIPTLFENYCYTDGDTNNVLETPIGSVGVALGWEQIRYDTLKRMGGKAQIVLAASCWWGFSENDSPELRSISKEYEKMAVNAPISMAKFLRIPVIHSSHNASYKGMNFPTGNTIQVRTVLGATQVIDADGEVTARLMYNEGPGLLISDVQFGNRARTVNIDDYWIPEMPRILLSAWDNLNPMCKGYYRSVSKPVIEKHRK